MRALSIFLWVFSAIFLALWAFAYLYIGGLACAFSGPNATNCGLKMPWELTGGDLTMLVYVPLGLLIVLLLAAIATGRAAATKKGAN